MKILCVIDSLGSGGAQRQLVGLAIGFKEKGHDVSILVYHNNNFFKNVLDEAKISVNAVIEPNYLKRLFKMSKYIRKGNYDAILSFLEAPNFICEIAGFPTRKWKLIVGERSANPNIFRSFKLIFYRWFHLIADYVVANSNENLKIVKKINPLLIERKCKVIYNMVDHNIWRPAIDYVSFKDGKLNLIVVASYQYLKNAIGLIEAIHLIKDKDKLRIKVDWYGDKGHDNSLNESIILVQKYNLENIFDFHEATKNICQKMQFADVVGLFSLYEGLPNAICEAMACGKPIISTNVSDIKLIITNGINGFLTESCGPESIRDSIVELLNCSSEELLKMGKNAETKARTLFNKDQIIAQYLELIN